MEKVVATVSGYQHGEVRNHKFVTLSVANYFDLAKLLINLKPISDMDAIAKSLKATLVLPSLDHTSFWADNSDLEYQFHGTSRGRGRGRGRGSNARVADKDHVPHEVESDPCTSIPRINTKQIPCPDPSEPKDPLKHETLGADSSSPTIRNFDLNADFAENEGAAATTATMEISPTAAAHPSSTAALSANGKKHELLEWSEVDRMSIDPLHFVNVNSRIDKEENYDEEM